MSIQKPEGNLSLQKSSTASKLDDSNSLQTAQWQGKNVSYGKDFYHADLALLIFLFIKDSLEAGREAIKKASLEKKKYSFQQDRAVDDLKSTEAYNVFNSILTPFLKSGVQDSLNFAMTKIVEHLNACDEENQVQPFGENFPLLFRSCLQGLKKYHASLNTGVNFETFLKNTLKPYSEHFAKVDKFFESRLKTSQIDVNHVKELASKKEIREVNCEDEAKQKIQMLMQMLQSLIQSEEKSKERMGAG